MLSQKACRCVEKYRRLLRRLECYSCGSAISIASQPGYSMFATIVAELRCNLRSLTRMHDRVTRGNRVPVAI